MLFPPLREPGEKEALRFGDRALSYRQLTAAVSELSGSLERNDRVAVWATPALESCVAVLAALASGAAAIPVNPRLGSHELEHILRDSAPKAVLAAPGVDLPDSLGPLPRIDVQTRAVGRAPSAEPPDETPALIVYTSGTTGPPKGVVLPRRAIASNLDALAEVWEWTANDVLVHGLPLFHVHGLILGMLGPVRLGGSLRHVVRFSPEAVARELAGGGTMLFGVPTMYHRLAAAAEADPETAAALAEARLLVSGSAPLPTREFYRIERVAGQRIVERYGMTETVMNCSVRASGDRRPGYVGLPLPGVDVRLVDDEGHVLDVDDDETIGEIEIHGPNLFAEYLNRPDATAEAFRGDWFRSGDLATRAPDGYIRIVGRRSTDLIKTGGFKVGAGEVEWALLDHPGVLEAAVTAEPDDDLGERIVAWIVSADDPPPAADALIDHVGQLLAAHKRPRIVRFLDELPRNEMGKVTKTALRTGPERSSTSTRP